MATSPVRAVQVVLPCHDLAANLEFFGGLGFRVDAIRPADSPAQAVVSGHGINLRLEAADRGAVPPTLQVVCDDPAAVAGPTAVAAGDALVRRSPDGTTLRFVPADPPIVVPEGEPSFVLCRDDPAAWHTGRAGMRYRDLIPGRQGGRFIASHIAIPDGGPVPDYVHFHKIRFQMIFCRRGWVKVAYEDQGEPILMEAGDCVLQPPRIRHRVLESSPGLEVVEIGCPADHETIADHGLALPTGRDLPERDFSGQRYVFHRAATATWRPWRTAGYEYRDIGIAAATDDLAGARVVRPCGPIDPTPWAHDGEFLFVFVLDGSVTLVRDGAGPERLGSGDSVVLPAGLGHALTDPAPGTELLEVSLPGALPTAR